MFRKSCKILTLDQKVNAPEMYDKNSSSHTVGEVFGVSKDQIQKLGKCKAEVLLSGVPQGSVLGHLVFTMYTRPLGIIVQRYGVKYYLYADDTQRYISLDPDNELNFSSSLKNLEHCIADIRLWMTQNLLKLNDNKTNIKKLNP